MLEENYRSSQPILDLTNEVIQNASEKFDKTLYTNIEGDTLPVLVNTVNENAQSKYVVNKIMEMESQGVSLGSIAVLFRSGWNSNDLEIELSSKGLSFMKYGGKKFVEAAHIKDVISFLRIVFNPNSEVDWYRILTLFRGIGQRTAERIVEEIKKNKNFDIDKKFYKKNSNIERLLLMLKEVDSFNQNPQEILTLILGFYYPLLTDYYDDYDKRSNDLSSLERIAERYSSLEELLSDLALDPPEKSFVENEFYLNKEESITLSTIHSAKGLEWDTVFIISMVEGCLPSYRSYTTEELIEEERRLFYVATTRAKKNLFLIRPQINNIPGQQGSSFTRISRFIDEGRILRDLVDVESHNVRQESRPTYNYTVWGNNYV